MELAETDVVVHAVQLVEYEFPLLHFRATVSPGTYLRALARDLGERLGTRAHLRALRREAIGPLRVEAAVPVDRIGVQSLLPPLAVLGHLMQLEVSPDQAEALSHGRTIAWPELPSPESDKASSAAVVALTVLGRLIAVARRVDGALHPEVVLEARN